MMPIVEVKAIKICMRMRTFKSFLFGVFVSFKIFKSIKNNKKSDLAINFAAAVELIHNASLLHDDVIEGAVFIEGEGRLYPGFVTLGD
jgi:hypothetical protein